MNKNRILSLEDLYNYYSSTSKRNRHFNAKDEDKNIVVQVPGNILFEKSNAQEGLTPVVLQSCHIGDNLNGSRIDINVMKKALPSFVNRPILGYIHEVDGEWQFYDHRMHMEDDELVYDERPIGIIPESCNASLEYDEEKDKTYVVVSGYLFDEYSHASEILERDGGCSCSVELNIRSLSYSVEDKILIIEDFFFSGVTALGCDPQGKEIRPGMSGANMKLADFTRHSVFSQDNVIVMLNEINKKIDQLSINNNQGKEEKTKTMNLFEKLMEQYEVTEEEIDFEYDGLSDEELTTLFEEKFAEKKKKIEDDAPASESGEETPSASLRSAPVISENEDQEDNSNDNDDDKDPESNDEDGLDDNIEENENEWFLELRDKDNVQKFSVSLRDKMNAVYNLVNEMYSEADNDIYDVDVFEDEKYVIMHGWCSGRHFKQQFSVKANVYSLKGDRTECFAQFLTEDEIKQLEQIKSNFSDVSEKLRAYESEPEKIEVLNSEDYSLIHDTEDFAEISKRENYFNLSKEELVSKLDAMLNSYAKTISKTDFSVKEPDKVTLKRMPIKSNKKTKKYGSLFDGI